MMRFAKSLQPSMASDDGPDAEHKSAIMELKGPRSKATGTVYVSRCGISSGKF